MRQLLKNKLKMNQKNRSRLSILVALFIGTLLFSIVLYNRNVSLSSNFITTSGRVTQLQTGGTAGGLQFTFKEHNLKYDPILGITWPSCRTLINKNFARLRKYDIPVVYDETDVGNAEILIFKDQYEKYNIEIPEELVEIVDELSRCKQ